MGLLGDGALIFWHDMRDGTDGDYQAWHSHEHMLERLAVPGFLRGRRGITTGTGSPRYLILYEVADIGVLTSEPYLARLNDPTGWTKRVVKDFINTNRTLSRVAASAGTGIGAFLTTIRFSPAAGKETDLQNGLSASVFPELVSRPGLSGAHLLQSDVEASHTDTGEKALRDDPDLVADWALLIEGYDAKAVEEAAQYVLSSDRTSGPGGIVDPVTDRFQIVHSISATDLG